jgi:hypothetical protein
MRKTWRAVASLGWPVAVAAFDVWVLVSMALQSDWFALALCSVCVFIAAVWVVHRFRYLRADPGGVQMKALLAAVKHKRMGKDEIWLNRDGHQVFTCQRQFGVVKLFVADEDQVRDIDACGAGVFTGTTYVAGRHIAGSVLRLVGGVRVEWDGDDVTDTTVRPSRRERARMQLRSVRGAYLSSQMMADADEIRQVIASLADAERIHPES